MILNIFKKFKKKNNVHCENGGTFKIFEKI